MQRGITGNDQHPADWQQQREQLSAYLDGELAPDDRAALETHLVTCPACQAELDDLRGLRAMLRAMPAPALPRSFMLPDEGAVPQPITARRTASLSPARTASRGPRITEWAGGLVASFGLALLLGSALAAHGGITASTALAPAGTSYNSQMNNGTPKGTTPSNDQAHTPATTTGGASTPGATSTPVATSAPGAATFTPTRPGPNGTAAPVSTSAVPPLLPIGGAGLFIGGAVVFVVGRTNAKRRTVA
jgi:hypothetical protein